VQADVRLKREVAKMTATVEQLSRSLQVSPGVCFPAFVL
jgi:hypothetical protein